MEVQTSRPVSTKTGHDVKARLKNLSVLRDGYYSKGRISRINLGKTTYLRLYKRDLLETGYCRERKRGIYWTF